MGHFVSISIVNSSFTGRLVYSDGSRIHQTGGANFPQKMHGLNHLNVYIVSVLHKLEVYTDVDSKKYIQLPGTVFVIGNLNPRETLSAFNS